MSERPRRPVGPWELALRLRSAVRFCTSPRKMPAARRRSQGTTPRKMPDLIEAFSARRSSFGFHPSPGPADADTG